MNLAELQVSNLRNIRAARLAPHPQINIITGANGSGKTSLLEAVYLLSSGHSFRTREISALITHEQDKLTVFAKTSAAQHISIQKALHLPTIAKIDGETCVANSELAAFLPCQVFYQDIFQLIDAGPTLRRNLLDWGMFHVEHDYLTLWKNYRRTLKQRNTYLKQQVQLKSLQSWDRLLAELATAIDIQRSRYIEKLTQHFEQILAHLTDIPCTLHYYRGWDRKNEGKNLSEILYSNYDTDVVRQYTQYGAHHADLYVIAKDSKIKHYLSRGQQKIILFALKFAQASILPKPCNFLIDDMASELDDGHITNLLRYITHMNGQFFISLHQSDYNLHHQKLQDFASFELKNGQLTD